MVKPLKYDGEKIRWDLVHWEAVEAMAKVLTYGAAKYDDDNWKKVLVGPKGGRRYFAAMMRHIKACERNGDLDPHILDPESGLPHISQAMTCMMFLCYPARERKRGR